MRFLAFLIMGVGLTGVAAAMDRGEFNSVKPNLRQWFQNMRSPKGLVCCSEADGHRTQYDLRQGQYWVPIDERLRHASSAAGLYRQPRSRRWKPARAGAADATGCGRKRRPAG